MIDFTGYTPETMPTVAAEKQGMDAFPPELFNSMVEYMTENGKHRNAALAVCAANWGMRFSDVCRVRVCEVLDEQGNFRTKFHLFEKKTKHTKKAPKPRAFYCNRAVRIFLQRYFDSTVKRYGDYIFTSESNNKKLDEDGTVQPMSHTAAENIIKGTLKAMGYDGDLKLNNHSYRKMYGKEFMRTGMRLMKSGEIELDGTMLTLLQNDFDHSSMNITQRYCGQMEETKEKIVQAMNLGLPTAAAIETETRKEMIS